ncbi:MAG: hypothetical protein WC661_03945 [Opitutaceae bacterium]|jgi:hypothetical protein
MAPVHTTPGIIKNIAGNRADVRRSGFALLITITLLAFLVLLLVSLASLTRVETQVASNNQQLVQARQNALMALNIALGELQKFTGPDQRTTARADIDSALANTTTANGRWLAAYGNGAPVDTTYSLKPSQIHTPITGNSNSKGSQAKLLNWLVSGNEGTAFDPSSTTTVETDGHIVTAPSSISYTPASAINLTTASATPAAADTQALLVGANSATAQSDYVAAPLVTINAAAGTVPGLTTAVPIGRYAWWVGDEGAKARVNLPMASAAQAPQAFVSAQRAGIELMDKAANPVATFDPLKLIGTADYDSTQAALPNVVSPGQLAMLTPSAATTLPAALRLRFHDLTATSTSVLADAYAGGLKKDLSAVLATGASSPAETDYLFMPENNVATDSFGVPTWGQLRSFVQTASSSGVLPVSRMVLGTPTSVGIAPVLTYVALGLKFVAPEGVANDKPIRLAVFPMVVLWNPYTATIPQHTYEVGVIRRFGNTITPTPRTLARIAVDSTGTGTAPFPSKEDVNFDKNLTTSGGTANTYVRFKVELPVGGIPAGASLVFTLPTGGAPYNAPLNGQPGNILTNGSNATGYVLVGSASFATGEAAKKFQGSGMLGGSGIAAYLGEVSSVAVSGAASFLNNNGSNNYQWHQFICTLSPGGVGGTATYWQGGAAGLPAATFFDDPVVDGVLYPTPALVCEVQMNFGYQRNMSANYPNVRWIAQTNPRAGILTSTPGGHNVLNFISSSGNQNWPTANFDTNGLRASSGASLNSSTAIVDTTLFEFRPDTQPLLGIGQLQHANLSLHNNYPAYPIGNSLADFHFVSKRDRVLVPYTMTSGVDNPPNTQITSYYDVSWLLNRALWDRYFVSSVPNRGTGTTYSGSPDLLVTASTDVPEVLPNPRHVKYGAADDEDLHDAGKAAANLLLKGGFNINSTSEQAWRAILGGINQLIYEPETGSTAGAPKLKAALPRFAKPTTPANAASAAWQGYRVLDEAQIARLATNIVGEIRNRGPFVSLADFVNRRLVDSSAAASGIDERIKGVIQAALDATFSGSGATNTATAPFDDTPIYPFDPATGSANYSDFDVELMQGGTTSTAPISSRANSAPQLLSQADVLSAIGGGLGARSDTFTIRTYGEAVNPVTQAIQGRAWCEAVVQRLPEYVKDASASSAAGDPAITVPGSLQNADNRKFGRRYKIISFRWLSLNDI